MRNRSNQLFLLASISPLALLAMPAAAQQNQGAVTEPVVGEAQAQGENPDQATIVVTGTRRTDRSVADSTVPVDVISAETLQNTGFTEINRALTQEVPSFNFPQPSITDGTDVIRPATLRGLGPDQTLVLINGKRRHTSALLNINGSVGRGTAAVDINLIPTIALSRVEVLRDGAAAQYGSDAIAGVINFQLRSARSGGRASVTYGQYETSVEGLETYTGVQTGPNNTPVLAPDGTLALNNTGNDRRRSDGRTVTLAAVVGVPVGADGYLNVAGEYQDRNATNRTGADPRRQFNLIAGTLDPRELTFNRFSHRYGDPETRDIKVFANGAIPLDSLGDAQIYAFGSYNNRKGASAAFYRLANDARNVPAIYPEGFLPSIGTLTKDYSTTVGLRGEAQGFRYDGSVQYGRDTVDFTIRNSLNRTLGAASPTRFDAGALRYDQTLVNVDISKDLSFGFAKKTTVSGGVEVRRETFDIRPGEPDSFRTGTAGGAPGSQGFPGFQPVIGGQQVDVKRSRNNKSAYAEIDADFSDQFNVQAALRYEDYSDFGSTLNGKLAARFEPVDGFAVRASASTGFRAPSLQQQFYAAQATNNVNGILLDTVTLPVDNPVAIALGASPLRPEKSRNYSVGTVISAIPRLNITVDAYQIDLRNRIVVTDNLTGTRGPTGIPIRAPVTVGGVTFAGNPTGAAIATILNNAGFISTNAARFFINGIDTRTRGLDFVVTYRVPTGSLGRLNLTAGFNYNKTKVRRNAAVPNALSNVPGLVLFGRQETLRLTRGQPKTKINGSADFDRGFFGATLRATRYGKVLGAGTDLFGDVNLKAKVITDLELRFKPIGDKAVFALGGNNIFDVYPTNTPRGRGVDPVTGAARNFPQTNYVAPFSNFSPFGFNGRYLYARLSVNY